MDSRHATLGRRTLEEIRQKRAAEKLSKTSSGPDLSEASIPIDGVGKRKSESANRLSKSDVSVLVAQIKDFEKKNAELKEQNKNLASMLETKEAGGDVLQKRLNDLEKCNGERCGSCCTGGSFSPASYAQETVKGCRGRTVSS